MSENQHEKGSPKDLPSELEFRRASAERLGGEERVEAHHASGRLTIRERIERLADPGSFAEVGKLTGSGEYRDGELVGHRPAPYVMGLASIGDRPVAVGGEDFTIRGGASWSGLRKKGGQGGFVEDLAFEYRIPLINLIDGAGGSVSSILKRGHTTFPGVHGFERSVDLLGVVPVVSAVLGSAAGGPAGRAILSHWSIMTKETAHVFAAGPPVVKRALGMDMSKEDLGGSDIASGVAGNIDNVAETEDECFEAVRRFLSYFPQNVWEMPPVVEGDDPADDAEELAEIVPANRRRPYDMRRLMSLIVDRESLFEIQPEFGGAVITSLARINGKPVGIVANDPRIRGGAVDAAAARKQAHFIELCDTFHIPLIFLVDVPGFMVGPEAEASATLREGMKSVYISLQATVPIFTVVIRKCYGMAGMATTGKNGLDFKIAWPTAEWGSLPIQGGVAAAFKREIAEASNPAEREAELEMELSLMSSPFRTAEAFGVEEIIDPRETRAYLSRFIDAAQGRLATSLGPKQRIGVRP